MTMETRANYVLIGTFAVAGFLGILGFFLWFAQIQLDRQFAYFNIDFHSVSGLSEASDVRFAGLPVGQVVEVRLSPEADGTIRVLIEVDAGTPIRTDSIATIEAQGVTGVSYVGISAGTPGAPLLAEVSEDSVPKIQAGRSVLQTLSQDAPAILAETLAVVRELRRLMGGENRQRVEAILANVEGSSASLSQALKDFSAISGTVSNFAREIDRFNTTLDKVTRDASGMLSAAEAALVSVNKLSEEARQVLAKGAGTLERAESTIGTADRYIKEDLSPTTEELGRSVAEVESRMATLSESANTLMKTFSATSEAATARLTEAKETIAATNALVARMDKTLGSVDAAARRFDVLITENGEPLLAELRIATSEATSVIRLIGKTAESDLPAILKDIRAATDSASSVVKTVGEDLSAASGRLDGLAQSAGETLDGARVTFAKANETLTAINKALETGDRALLAAEKAFDGADRVMTKDIAEITVALRRTLDELGNAVGAVAEDIPGVTKDLRAASHSAETAFAEIEGTVGESAPAFREFATTALPQYKRLAIETRALIDNLDKLIEQIRRDPSRFFLDPRAPQFRR